MSRETSTEVRRSRTTSPAIARAFLAAIAVGAVAATASPARASPSETRWVGASTTTAVTGDITIGNGALRMAGKRFPMTLVERLSGTRRTSAAMIFPMGLTSSSVAALYRTNIPAKTVLYANNTICGSDAATWIVTVRSPAAGRVSATLQMAVFSGAERPNLDPTVVSKTKTLCGTYLYDAKP